MKKMMWYNRTWVIILFCIFLPPVGIVLVWIHPNFSKQAKVIWTVIVSFLSIAAVFLFNKYKDKIGRNARETWS
jgi:hypothetical protein